MSYSETIVAGDAANALAVYQTWFTRYDTLTEALVNAQDNARIIVVGGTINEPLGITFNSHVSIRGLGNPLVRVNGDGNFNYNAGANLTFDALRFQSSTTNDFRLYANIKANDVRIHAHRVGFHHGVSLSYGVSMNLSSPPTDNSIKFEHCRLTRSNGGGDRYHFLSVRAQSVALSKVEFVEPLRGFNIQGAFYESDYVNTPTPGYGPEEDDTHIIPTPELTVISSRVIDLKGGAAKRVIVFDWNSPERYVAPDIDSDGNWSVAVPTSANFGIYYLSDREIYPPAVHGPYTAT